MPGWLWLVFIGIGILVAMQAVKETKDKTRRGGDNGTWYGGSDTGLFGQHHHHSATDGPDSDGDGGGNGDAGGGDSSD